MHRCSTGDWVISIQIAWSRITGETFVRSSRDLLSGGHHRRVEGERHPKQGDFRRPPCRLQREGRPLSATSPGVLFRGRRTQLHVTAEYALTTTTSTTTTTTTIATITALTRTRRIVHISLMPRWLLLKSPTPRPTHN